jgi:hypothetical protein
VCEAEMQIRALARRRGVAGNATVTTATYIKVFYQSHGKSVETFVKPTGEHTSRKFKKNFH